MKHNIGRSNGGGHGILAKLSISCPATNTQTAPMLAAVLFMLALLPALGQGSQDNSQLVDIGEGWHRFSWKEETNGKVYVQYLKVAEGWHGNFLDVPHIVFNCSLGFFDVHTNSRIELRHKQPTEPEKSSVVGRLNNFAVVDVQIWLDQGPHIEETWWVYGARDGNLTPIGDQVSYWMSQLIAADTVKMSMPMWLKEPLSIEFNMSKAREILPDDGEGGCR